MTNNDILRRLRYSFNFNDDKMRAIFALADLRVTQASVSAWLKKDDEQGYQTLTDQQLAHFLNGLITEKRGKKDGPQPVAEKRLNNNLILTKLKIALNLKAEEIIELLKSVDFNLSKAELSALFRRPDHQHFRECKDQILRNFLKGLQQKLRPATTSSGQKTSTAKVKQKENRANTDKKINKNSARPNASKIYHNPNANKAPTEQSDNKPRKTLKLKPEQIWGK